MELPLHLLSDNFIKTKNITASTVFELGEVPGNLLLTPERLDLAAKLAYIEAKENGGSCEFARELYAKHIEAFSEGNFTEPGDDSKNSLDRFFEVFDELIEDFKANGFDDTKSLIPVGRDNVILDGAHRTACAIYFNKNVKIIRFPDLYVDFGYDYFRRRRLSEELLGYMAVVYSKYARTKLYCACVWPVAAPQKREAAAAVIKRQHKIVIDTDVELSRNGLRNLMLQIYQHQSWVGTEDTHFHGVMGKVDACYTPGAATEVVLFEGGELAAVLEMKDEIRGIFKIDKHAIHISDSNDEAKLMAELLLNENSVHSLNYGKPDAFPECWRLLLKTDPSAILSARGTMAFYGICNSENLTEGMPCYTLNDPRTYFVFFGRKLPALHIVRLHLSEKSSDYGAVCSILRKSNPQHPVKRRLRYLRTTLAWRGRKAALWCKQLAARAADAVGLYEMLHRLLNKVRK